jgi:15-cis-phytoene synthase
MIQQPTATDWHACARVTRENGRSFYLASRLLPAARRRAILAAYAYCRIADDIVDQADVDGVDQARRHLMDWGHQLRHPVHPVAIAFAAARQQYEIPDEPVEHLLHGIASDLIPADLEDWHDLERYCYLVAGTVGLMVAPILGCKDRGALSHAAELGIAMQLTNILRDVAEDAAMGRLYLPREELAWYGVSGEAVLAGVPEPGFREFMIFQVGRARLLYASALLGVPALCLSGRATTLAAARLYHGILDRIEAADYDVFAGRAIVPGRQRARIMSGVIGQWVIGSFQPAPPPSSVARSEEWSYPGRLMITAGLESIGTPGQHHD